MRRSTEPQSRRHIWVFDEDWAYLEKHFGEALGVGPSIRQIVRLYVNQLRAKTTKKLDEPQAPEDSK